MDRKEYAKPEVQDKIRSIVNGIIVEEGMKLTDVARHSGLSYPMIHHFIGKEKRIGKEAVRRFLTFISRYGYDASTLEKKDDE